MKSFIMKFLLRNFKFSSHFLFCVLYSYFLWVAMGIAFNILKLLHSNLNLYKLRFNSIRDCNEMVFKKQINMEL